MNKNYSRSPRTKQKGINYIYLIFGTFLIIGCFFVFKAYQFYAQKEAKAELVRQLVAKRDIVKSILVKWDDAKNLAAMTARISLAQPLSQMQSIRRELTEIRLNDCFNSGADKIVSGMNDAISGFEFFIRFPSSPSASETTARYFKSSEESIIEGQKAIGNCIKQ